MVELGVDCLVGMMDLSGGGGCREGGTLIRCVVENSIGLMLESPVEAALPLCDEWSYLRAPWTEHATRTTETTMTMPR